MINKNYVIKLDVTKEKNNKEMNFHISDNET